MTCEGPCLEHCYNRNILFYNRNFIRNFNRNVYKLYEITKKSQK